MPLQDLRYAARCLRKSAGFTAVALLVMALGIGANTAIFSLVSAVLLRPLPYRNSDRLVLLNMRIPQLFPHPIPVSSSDIPDLERELRSVEGLAAYYCDEYDLFGQGEAEKIATARVSWKLFPLLGIAPMRGRWLTREEDESSRPVVLLSYALWQRSFGFDPAVIGRTIKLNRKLYTIIGVMPRGFQFPLSGPRSNSTPAEVWIPVSFTPRELQVRGDSFNFGVIARLRPGVVLAQANREAEQVAARIKQSYGTAQWRDLELRASLAYWREEVSGPTRRLLLVLLGAVGFVLLIACANIATLLLARSAARRKEVAIRTALGAGRGRLAGQFLAEGLLLSSLGGALGILLALWGTGGLVSALPRSMPLSTQVGLDWRVLVFSLGISMLCGLALGVLPVLSLGSRGLNEALKEGGRASAAATRNHWQGALIAGEVALSVILLSGAGLLIRSFVQVRQADAGFQPQHVLSMSIALPADKYARPEERENFYVRLLDRLRTVPSVKAAGAATDLPLEGNWMTVFTREGAVASQPKAPVVAHSVVYGDYFSTLLIPLRRGRYFSPQDGASAPRVAIISETAARRFWRGEDPLGQRIHMGPADSKEPLLTIVGIVADVKSEALDGELRPHVYVPYLQASRFREMRVVLRTALDPSQLVTAARAQVRAIDPEQAVTSLRSMEQVVAESVAPRRFNTWVLGVFAGSALLLAALGLYGVMAYSVGSRVREIGLRMALGARPGRVLLMILGSGMRLAAIGLATGLVGSLALTRLLANLLYGVKPTDMLTFAGVSLVLATTALLASYLPARRATRVDPMVALRCE
jgi:putative ABC transport system permease protein